MLSCALSKGETQTTRELPKVARCGRILRRLHLKLNLHHRITESRFAPFDCGFRCTLATPLDQTTRVKRLCNCARELSRNTIPARVASHFVPIGEPRQDKELRLLTLQLLSRRMRQYLGRRSIELQLD